MQHDILNWDARPAFDEWVQARLERGTQIEKLIVMPELMRMGFEVVGGQQSCEIKSRDGSYVICTGHIDAILEHEGYRVVMDCKSMHPILWRKVNTVEDLLRDKFGYRYPWQLLLYMYAHELDTGLFLVDDCLGHWKTIPIYLWDHAERCEEALTRCEQVMAAIDDGEMLPHHDDPAHCRECWCFQVGVCAPPMDFTGQGIQIITSDEMAEGLERMEQLAEPADEYRHLDGHFKGSMKARPDGRYLVGDFIIEKVTGQTTIWDVPDDIKAPFKASRNRVTTKWSRINKGV